MGSTGNMEIPIRITCNLQGFTGNLCNSYGENICSTVNSGSSLLTNQLLPTLDSIIINVHGIFERHEISPTTDSMSNILVAQSCDNFYFFLLSHSIQFSDKYNKWFFQGQNKNCNLIWIVLHIWQTQTDFFLEVQFCK